VIQRLSLARSLSEIQQIVRVAARRLTGADGAAFVLRDGELDAARREGLERLALAAEYRDDGTREHPARVGYTSLRLAQVLGMDDDRASLIGQAAALHDVGKLAIPDAILLKRNKLAEHEFEKLKTHTIAGAAILGGSQSTLMRPAEQIALTHHERWDGSGYPNGLAGPDIPMTGRIVALADVFDALTHPRPYKAAWSIDATLSEIRSLGGKQFDPAVIDAFMELDPTELVELREDAGLVATGPPV
jgi:response regulator RpfG family c-di-GMP phosphodiesterase